MPTIPYKSRSAWRRVVTEYRREFSRTAERYITTVPYECPAKYRAPHSASAWLAMTEDERRDVVRTNAHAYADEQAGPMPAPAQPRLTLGELERLTIRRAERKADELRAMLNGDSDVVEQLIAAQMPAIKGQVFDELVKYNQITT